MAFKSITLSSLLVAGNIAFASVSQAAQLPEMEVGTTAAKVPADPLVALQQATNGPDDFDTEDAAAADSAN